MPKKKPSKKTTGKSGKKSAKASARPGKQPSHPVLEHWKQRPGTFTYELSHPKGTKFVCHAKHVMSDEDLFMQFILHNTFDTAGRLKPGETKIFNAVDDPMKTFAAMIRNPPPGWERHVRGLIIRQQIQQRQRVQNALKTGVLAKRKGKTTKAPTLNGVCINCHGRRWVCEDHPTLPWEMSDSSGCPCCAPGMACPDCNPTSSPAMGPAYSQIHNPPLLNKAKFSFGKEIGTDDLEFPFSDFE